MKNLIYLFLIVVLAACSNSPNAIPDNFDFGKTTNGLYTNEFFNLEIPFNPEWVIQDRQEMNDLVKEHQDKVVGDSPTLKNAIKASEVNTAYLFTLFKYDIDAGKTDNSSIMLVAENTKNAPGIDDGSDYLFSAKKLLKQTQIPYSFDKEVYERQIGNSKFYVLETKIDLVTQVITQEYISTVKDGFSLSFIVSYSSNEDRDELYKMLDNIKI